MSAEFSPYDSGFGKHKFNRLLKLIRKYRVLPNRPGWEQTPDGIMPPPILSGASVGSSRPFQVTQTGDNTVSVASGRVGIFGSGWSLPSWSGGDAFNADKTISETSYLFLTFTISQARGSDGPGSPGGPSISIGIGWYVASGLPEFTVGLTEYEFDSGGGSVSESFNPETNYQTGIGIATVEFSDGEISSITQYLDYNITVPSNVNRFYQVIGV